MGHRFIRHYCLPCKGFTEHRNLKINSKETEMHECKYCGNKVCITIK